MFSLDGRRAAQKVGDMGPYRKNIPCFTMHKTQLFAISDEILFRNVPKKE